MGMFISAIIPLLVVPILSFIITGRFLKKSEKQKKKKDNHYNDLSGGFLV